ncbi:MAG: GtrA family protein [Clostridia bacterium]|nr:GtrA family protein [Clostridia bacterium]
MKKDTALAAWKQKLIAFVKSEIFSYLFFGVCTTVVNIIVFQFCYSGLHIPTLIANVIAWVLSVAFAYLTNRRFVFHSTVNTREGILREIASFVGARLFSLAFDELIIWLTVDVMGYTFLERFTAGLLHIPLADAKALVGKICANVVVVILNYIFSKLFIFRKNHSAR